MTIKAVCVVRLYDDLLSAYNTQVIPGDQVVVSFGLTMLVVSQIEEATGDVEVLVWHNMVRSVSYSYIIYMIQNMTPSAVCYIIYIW